MLSKNHQELRKYLTGKLLDNLMSLYIPEPSAKEILSFFEERHIHGDLDSSFLGNVFVTLETHNKTKEIQVKTCHHTWEFDISGAFLSKDGLTPEELAYNHFDQNLIIPD